MPFDSVLTISNRTREILRGAADILEQRGLCKGTYFDPETGAVCTYTAIAMADGGNMPKSKMDGPAMSPDAVEARWCFELAVSLPNKGVCGWNNEPERTAEDAVSALRAFSSQ